ncbi:MAG: hypothetical protein KGH74_01990 [Candidatus Micrarchaeota archaeon]|nr:hypothetical protein [Candidatus Micrarchaeota archaeon]
MVLLLVLLTLGSIGALVPLLIIIILLVAAAGSTRGYSIFNLFGIATLAGFTPAAGRGGLAGKTGLSLGIYFQRFIGAKGGGYQLGGKIKDYRAAKKPTSNRTINRAMNVLQANPNMQAPGAAASLNTGIRTTKAYKHAGKVGGIGKAVGKVGFAVALPVVYVATKVPKIAHKLDTGRVNKLERRLKDINERLAASGRHPGLAKLSRREQIFKRNYEAGKFRKTHPSGWSVKNPANKEQRRRMRQIVGATAGALASLPLAIAAGAGYKAYKVKKDREAFAENIKTNPAYEPLRDVVKNRGNYGSDKEFRDAFAAEYNKLLKGDPELRDLRKKYGKMFGYNDLKQLINENQELKGRVMGNPELNPHNPEGAARAGPDSYARMSKDTESLAEEAHYRAQHRWHKKRH